MKSMLNVKQKLVDKFLANLAPYMPDYFEKKTINVLFSKDTSLSINFLTSGAATFTLDYKGVIAGLDENMKLGHLLFIHSKTDKLKHALKEYQETMEKELSEANKILEQ